MEKESIGIFISAHPLKQVREALRARVDCSLTDLAARRDGEWVTVGGIITEAKRIRTKKGDPMMFATLDDLEGDGRAPDLRQRAGRQRGGAGRRPVVVVRGRVDHKEAGKSCVVVQEVVGLRAQRRRGRARARGRAGAPPATPRALRLRVDAALLAPTVIDDLKHIFENHPGEAEVVLEMRTTSGRRALRFGDRFRVAPSVGLNADLHEVLGPAALA